VTAPYAGSIGLFASTPSFGKHFLDNNRLQAPEWSFLAGRPLMTTDIFILGGFNYTLMAQGAERQFGWHWYSLVDAKNWSLPLSSMKMWNLTIATAADKIIMLFDVQS